MASMFVLAVGVNPIIKLIASTTIILVGKLPQMICPQSHPFECLICRQRTVLEPGTLRGVSAKTLLARQTLLARSTRAP
jgi:hypothetical protein